MESKFLKTFEEIKFKKRLTKIRIDLIDTHPNHVDFCQPAVKGLLDCTIARTGNEPVNPPIVIPKGDRYQILKGSTRLDSMINLGQIEVEVFVIEGLSKEQETNFFFDLRRQRKWEGIEFRKEFEHFMTLYPPKKGVKNYNRYELIAKELGISKQRVKDLITLIEKLRNTIHMKIADMVFCGQISLRKGERFCKLIGKRTISENLRDKIVGSDCDPEKVLKHWEKTNFEDDLMFDLLLPQLTENTSDIEVDKTISQLNRTKDFVENYQENKTIVVNITDEYRTENSLILNGDSRLVKLPDEYLGKVNVIVGSAEYGYGTKRPPRDWCENHKELSEMTAQDFACYLSEIYARFLEYLSDDGSVYVVLNDYIDEKSGCYSTFLEYFVLEMISQGFFLVGRKQWNKKNPMPRQYSFTDSVEGFEYIYRFSKKPNGYYNHPFLFIQNESKKILEQTTGCTNHGSKKTGVKGTKYFQSNLKKIVNILDEGYCKEIIRGNVGNPGDFFRQTVESEDRHGSTSPIYLTASLILESTKPNDVVLDIWNGVGNTGLSALLLGRKYVGIEIEPKYFKQTVEKINEVENFIEDHDIMNINN